MKHLNPKLLAALRKQSMHSEQQNSSFEEFSATELYCPKCKEAKPVKEKLLLTLQGGNMYDYVCSVCGTSVGTKR